MLASNLAEIKVGPIAFITRLKLFEVFNRLYYNLINKTKKSSTEHTLLIKIFWHILNELQIFFH